MFAEHFPWHLRRMPPVRPVRPAHLRVAPLAAVILVGGGAMGLVNLHRSHSLAHQWIPLNCAFVLLAADSPCSEIYRWPGRPSCR